MKKAAIFFIRSAAEGVSRIRSHVVLEIFLFLLQSKLCNITLEFGHGRIV